MQCVYSFYIRVTSLPPFLMIKREGLKRRKLWKAIHKRKKNFKSFLICSTVNKVISSSPNPRHSRHVTQKSWNFFFDLLANSKLLNKFADILLSLLLGKIHSAIKINFFLLKRFFMTFVAKKKAEKQKNRSDKKSFIYVSFVFWGEQFVIYFHLFILLN